MMSFIQSENEIRMYRVSSGNKLDGGASYVRDVSMSLDFEAGNVFLSILMYLQIVKRHIYP